MRGIEEQNIWRYNALGMFLAVISLLIIGQVVRLQFSASARNLETTNQEIYRGEYKMVYPARGLIYDRWGHLLASNQIVYEAGVELADVENPETIALTLSNVLGLDYATVLGQASLPYLPGSSVYSVLTDYVTEEEKNKIEQFGEEFVNQYRPRDKSKKPPSLKGLVFHAHLERSYPEGEIGSNLVGFVNKEGDGFGVEKYFNELLAGTPQQIFVPLDPNMVEDVRRPPSGTSLVLTIDRQTQLMAEDVLDNAVKQNDAEGGTILITNPKTGEILAMASTPRMNLNRYWEYSDIFPGSTPFNKAVSQAYEPGSVFKVLTMAAGLDSGAVKPDTVFVDTGQIEIGGLYIYNWNMGAWGPQDMTGCMQHSLNVCLTYVAMELGAKRFYSYMEAFGFGHVTGIELAGENSGRLKRPGDGDWYEADLGTNSFGQGISVTPVQMAMAVGAVANDEGKLIAPHIVRSIITNGHQYDTPVQVLGNPIKPESARTLSEMLAVSLEGESSDALVDGYRVAGKTGTAEIPTPTGYTSNVTNASFVGWGPVDDPQFLVYVWLEKPTSSIWGSVVAAPVFKEVVERLVVLMDIPPDNIRNGLKAGLSANP